MLALPLTLMLSACHGNRGDSPAAGSQNSSSTTPTAEVIQSEETTSLQSNLQSYYQSLPPLPQTSPQASSQASFQTPAKITAAATTPVPLVTAVESASDAIPAPAVVSDGDAEENLDAPENFSPIIPTKDDLQKADLSPISILHNLMCDKAGPGRCLPALNPAFDQAVGYYYGNATLGVGGSLLHAAELPEKGQGFRQKSGSRAGRFATDHAVHFIESLAAQLVQNQVIDLLVIGDIAKKDGGNFPGHVSHQSGLDIDIGFLPSGHQQNDLERFPGNDIAGDHVSSQFGLIQNWHLVSAAFNTGSTYLILAHPAVKKAFCQMAAKSPDPSQYNAMLSQIVPDVTHFDHFHFRLKCPVSSPRCVPGPNRSKLSGCEELLNKAPAPQVSAKRE